jgi:hypothetical protein
MISSDFALIIPLAGLILIVTFRFYSGKYSFVLLIGGVFLIVLRFLMDKVTILNDYRCKKSYYTIKSNIEYVFSNGETQNVSVGSNTLINDTPEDFTIEEVHYSSTLSFGNGNTIVQNVKPFSSYQLENGISDYFDEPPQQISVKRGSSTTRYWLH